MQLKRSGLAIAVGIVLMSGCGGSPDDGAKAPAATATESADACMEVRAGIDAFNLGDYVETISRFRKAVPLAVDQAESDDSQAAADLVEAVKYYADLDAEQYPEAARSSEDFARYKAITLGQCVPVGEPGVETEPPPVTT